MKEGAQLPPEFAGQTLAPPLHHGLLYRIPEPWHARITGRRYRRWRRASRAIARYNARLPEEAPTLNFFPMRPQPGAPMSEMVRLLKMRIGFRPQEGEPTIAWDGDTWFSARSARRLPSNAINGGCLDISKTRVHEEWLRVAGRSVVVDPLTYDGKIVIKPEENGRHGGRVVHGPLQARERGFVYERLVDTRVGEHITQTRPVLVGGEIVVAYEKWREPTNLFFSTLLTLPREPNDLYSASEQAEITAIAVAMDLDYGELDVLRDAATGEMHVVDVNRTPSRPRGLPDSALGGLWERQADAFLELLLRPRGFLTESTTA